jgi:ribonuclease T2
MIGQRVWQAVRGAAVVASFTFILAVVALAQEGGSNAPGRFDFYVLSLSWSPSYCEAARQRAPNRPPGPQCGGRPFSFVVHGLWPQFERGFPSYCEVPAPRLARAIVNTMLDLMPSPQLIFHEWDRHGTCSGLAPRAYFDAVRKAYAAVKIPDDYRALDKPAMVRPDEVVAAFVKANPGLSPAAIAVGCDSKRLNEVRLCLNKDFSFHDCAQVVHRTCRRDKIAMPAVRGATN